MRRALVATAAVLLALTTGCSTSSDQAGPSGPANGQASASGSTQDQAPATLDVTVRGDQITPNGERLQVGTGQTVTLNVDSDRAGGFHVHSSPEQQLEFHKGRTTLRFSVDRPGVVDVEEHESGLVVVQLEVR